MSESLKAVAVADAKAAVVGAEAAAGNAVSKEVASVAAHNKLNPGVVVALIAVAALVIGAVVFKVM